MIYDSINNISEYLSKEDSSTIVDLLEAGVDKLEIGKTVINEHLYVLHQKYVGKDEATSFPEKHNNYLDVQIILKNAEVMGFDLYREDMELEIPYSKEKDVLKTKTKCRSHVLVNANEFAIFYPNDLHHPCIKVNDEEIEKLVVKIKVN